MKVIHLIGLTALSGIDLTSAAAVPVNCTRAGASRSPEQEAEFINGIVGDGLHDALPSWLSYNVLLYILAFAMGLGKGGVPGSSTTSVALNALYAPDGCLDLATAMQVPVTAISDCAVVISYFKNARWDLIMRLMPSCGVGIAIGSQLVGALSASQSKLLVGSLLLGILMLNFMEELQKSNSKDNKDRVPAYAQSLWFTSFVGVVGGFATILTNSMGPILNAFFVLLQLDPTVFVATRATFFTAVNGVKFAQRMYAGTLTMDMLWIGGKMGLFAIVGVVASKPIMKRISKSLFVKLQYGSMTYVSFKLLYAGSEYGR